MHPERDSSSNEILFYYSFFNHESCFMLMTGKISHKKIRAQDKIEPASRPLIVFQDFNDIHNLQKGQNEK